LEAQKRSAEEAQKRFAEEAQRNRAAAIEIINSSKPVVEKKPADNTKTRTSSVSAVGRNLKKWRQSILLNFTQDMKINLDVLTTPSVDTPGTTLMLTIHDSKYVFGQIGEGSQRAWLENGVRMSKISKLFLTGQINWKNTGGLLGVILTLADVVGTRRRMLQEIRKRKAEEMKERGGDNGQVSVCAIHP